MDSQAEAIAQLKEFGVPTYAARAYLALLELGVSDARGVSDVASIPSAKVYGALTHLEKRGLAEVTPGKPRKYAAVAMSAFLARQLREQEARIEELRMKASEIAELFPVGAGAALAPRPQTVTIEGKRNILQHLREACDGAKTSILASLEPPLRSELTLRRPFEDAGRRGVTVGLIEDAGARASVPSCASMIATFDESAAMIVRLRRGSRKEGTPSSAIFTTDPGFVAPLQRLLVARRDAVAAPRGTERRAANVDPTTFERLLHEQAGQRPREALVVLHAAQATELEKDKLWRASRLAARTRVLLSPPTPRPPDPGIIASFPPEAEVKFLPRASAVAFTILDGHRVFFVNPPRRDRPEDAVYGSTAESVVVRAFESQFEAHWSVAVSLGRPRS